MKNLKNLLTSFAKKETEIYKINYAEGFLKDFYETFKETLSSKLPSNAGEYLFKVNR